MGLSPIYVNTSVIGPLPGFNTFPVNPRNAGKIVPINPGGGGLFQIRPNTPHPLNNVPVPYAPPLPGASGGKSDTAGWGTDPATAPTYNGPTVPLSSTPFGGNPITGAIGRGVSGLSSGIQTWVQWLLVNWVFGAIFLIGLFVFLSHSEAGTTVIETVKGAVKDAGTAALLA